MLTGTAPAVKRVKAADIRLGETAGLSGMDRSTDRGQRQGAAAYMSKELVVSSRNFSILACTNLASAAHFRSDGRGSLTCPRNGREKIDGVEPSKRASPPWRLGQQGSPGYRHVLGHQDPCHDRGRDRRRRPVDDSAAGLCGEQPDLSCLLRRHGRRPGQLGALPAVVVLGRGRRHDNRRHDDVRLPRSHAESGVHKIVADAVCRRSGRSFRMASRRGQDRVREHNRRRRKRSSIG